MLLSSGVLDNVVYQDNHLVYDAQNRLRAVFDSRADVRITYDLAGNRSQVTTHVINTIRPDVKSQPANVVVQDQQVIHTSTTAYGYDAMNRQIRSQEVSSVTGAVDTHQYRYDYAGNRTQDQTYSGGPIEGSPNGKLEKTYNYVYDDLNRMASYTGYGVAERTDQILYDGAGRQVYAKSLVKANNLWNEEHRYNRYDATGKLQDTHVVVRRDDTKAVTQRTDVAYHDAGGVTGLGYDAAGNLLGNRQVSDGNQGNATTTTYGYQYINGSYQQTSASTWSGVFNGTKPPDAATKTWRDANGFVSNIEQTVGAADERFNRAFVNDAQGNAVYVNQGAGHTGRVQNQPGGYLGGWVGDSVNPGHVQRQLVANGEVLARYGDAPDSEKPPNPGEIPNYVDTAEFRLNAAPLKLKGANLDAIAYTVVDGETLKDIARNVLGDAKLWWRIAEANGLAVSGDGKLVAGQTLSVPKLALNANNVDTFQPYDPSRVTGSLDPNLPAPAGQGGGGCGGLGKIIMVAIAVVVSVYTAGLMSGASGSLLTTMQAGMGVMSGGTLGGAVGTFVAGSMSTAGIVTTAAAAGAMGSIASQVVGNAIGAQDGFSWKGVALSALGSGVTSGLGASGLLPTTDSVFANAALRQAVSSTISQGVGVVTGLQQRFDWKSVAAGAVGAGVGASVGQALQSANVFSSLGGGFGTDLARGAVSGFAGGMVTAVMRGGRVSVQQVATDAFGNALGQSLAAGNGQSSGDASRGDLTQDLLGEFIEQNQNAWNRSAIAADLNTALLSALDYVDNLPYEVGYQVADATRFGSGKPLNGGTYIDAAGRRVQTIIDSDVGQPSIDAMLMQAKGMLNGLASSAGRNVRDVGYVVEQNEATADLYADGAGDVRGPFYAGYEAKAASGSDAIATAPSTFEALGNIAGAYSRGKVDLATALSMANSQVGGVGNLGRDATTGVVNGGIGVGEFGINLITGMTLQGEPGYIELPKFGYTGKTGNFGSDISMLAPMILGLRSSGPKPVSAPITTKAGGIGESFTPPPLPGSMRTVSFGKNEAVFKIDSQTSLPLQAEGLITGPHPGRGKGYLPEPVGGRVPGEHRGHLIPEGGVDNAAYVNNKNNLISEAPGSNLGLKKSLDLQVSRLAALNPNSEIRFFGQPIREAGQSRPFAVSYYITQDGKLVNALSILNK